jgi:hypothetical protein
MSWRIMLSDGRLWAVGADGWSGRFRTVGYSPRLWVGFVVAESSILGRGGGGAVIGRGGRAWCTRLDNEGRAVCGRRCVGLG